MAQVTKEQIKQAKQIDTLSYLMSCVPDQLLKKGHEYCTREHSSLSLL